MMFWKRLGGGEIHLLDTFDDTLFEDSDFIDTDHLGDTGAEKITKIVLDTLREMNM